MAAATRSGSRPVATTAWPAAKAALAMSVPMPRPAPVISQTGLLIKFLLSGLGGVLVDTCSSGCLAPAALRRQFGRAVAVVVRVQRYARCYELVDAIQDLGV